FRDRRPGPGPAIVKPRPYDRCNVAADAAADRSWRQGPLAQGQVPLVVVASVLNENIAAGWRDARSPDRIRPEVRHHVLANVIAFVAADLAGQVKEQIA